MVDPIPHDFAEWPLRQRIQLLCDIATREQLLTAHRGGLHHPTGSGSRRLSKPELAELLIERELYHDLDPYGDPD